MIYTAIELKLNLWVPRYQLSVVIVTKAKIKFMSYAQ